MNGNKPGLLGPSGQPLFKEAKLIVMKLPRGIKIHPQIIGQLSKQSGCNIITLPMDSELMMGNLAVQELNSTHAGIHAILGLVNVNFTKEELHLIHHYIKTVNEPPLGETKAAAELIKKVEAVLIK